MESEPTRKTPNFNTRLAHSEIKEGLFQITLVVLPIYLLVRAFLRGIDPESIFMTWYSWIIPFLCILGILGIIATPSLFIVFTVGSVLEGFSVLRNKRQWLENAAQAKAIIVDKRTRWEWDYSDEYSYQIHFSELKLKYSPILATNNSSEQVLWATISHSDYEKYQPGDTINIFYSIGDPTLFLIEGE